jgi:soluble cytochrome b562
LLTGSGIFCGWALLWLTRIPPLPDCEQITPFHSASDLLYCAKAQARTGEPNNLVQSVLLTANWPKTHANYDDSQEILKDASEQILVLANRWAQAGKLDDAVALADQIPLNTPLRKSAQSVIFEWQQDWEQGQAIEAKLKPALAASDWELAKTHLQEFKTLKSDYWLTTRYVFWQRQFQVEHQGWDQLLQARELAKTNQIESLRQAVVLARAIDLRSQVWQAAESDVDRWSKTVLDVALQRWEVGDRPGALELARVVPPTPDLAPEAQALLALSHAQTLARQAEPVGEGLAPRYSHLFGLMEAVSAVNQLPANSPYAAADLSSKEQWGEQLTDLRQLKFSDMVARLGQQTTYEWAIRQAQRVEVGRPRRIQGQTLIAQWQFNLQRIEDRPILTEARSLARPGTVAALQSAMAKASEVELGRALRVEAQTLVAEWQQEIQVIEDRPILDAAVALANQGKLPEAIAEANKIQPSRALHSRAQGLVQEWTATIQIAEDKPILDEAKDLAYGGSLSAAINLASQIGPGRALYDEARAAIALWTAERAYIWSIWEAEGRSVPGGGSASDDSPSTEPQ